jgi:hypothetical protein
MGVQLSIVPPPEHKVWVLSSKIEFLEDCEKMRAGNKAAARRVRVHLHRIRKFAKQVIDESKQIKKPLKQDATNTKN